MPQLLNYSMACYLIIIGQIGLFGAGNSHFQRTVALARL
jgi:hypothetical protein